MNRLFQVPSRVSLTNRPYLQRGVLRFKASQSSDAIKRPVQKLVLPEPDDPRPRWGVTANKISSFVIIPCMFSLTQSLVRVTPPPRWVGFLNHSFVLTFWSSLPSRCACLCCLLYGLWRPRAYLQSCESEIIKNLDPWWMAELMIYVLKILIIWGT